MSRSRVLLAVVCIALVVGGLCGGPSPSPYSTPSLNGQETKLTKDLEKWADAQTAPGDMPAGTRWVLRSKHFIFGMPRLADDRHNFKPSDDSPEAPGVSVLVREAFVAGHSDRLRSPIWVCQGWTKIDHARMALTPSQGRPWKLDLEVPSYARAKGTKYDQPTSKMDRGHMALHSCNRAWGPDASRTGCLMSNSAPQHVDVNKGDAWRNVEDAARDIVGKQESGIKALWTISGAIFRCKECQDPADKDFENAEKAKIGDEYPLPTATYKIVAWFGADKKLRVRGYVFEQTDKKPDPVEYLTPIDKIEARTGIDFFSMLNDADEDAIEAAENDDMWGAE